MKNETEVPSYETALRELQEIVARLQQEAVAMDELSDKVNRAAYLIQFCREKLRSTGEEVERVLEGI